MRANDRPEAGIIGQQCRCDFSTVVQTVEEFPLIRLQREDEGEQVLALSDQSFRPLHEVFAYGHDPSTATQIISPDTGVCWEADFNTAKKNAWPVYKAVSD
ncbi:MAG: hypothetical protein VCA74_04940 [Deltaproteobacteria bacterium]